MLGPDGKERARLRTGLELPVAPIVTVTTGRLRGATEPEVLLGTAGAGVLVVESSRSGALSVQQILPATAEAANISALQVLASGDLLLGTRHAGVLVFDGTALAPLAMPVAGLDAGRLQVTALAAAGRGLRAGGDAQPGRVLPARGHGEPCGRGGRHAR